MTAPSVVMSELWPAFRDFVTWEKQAGGPDPHMAVVVHLARYEPWIERAWRGGCYIGAYNVPGAELIWKAWPWPAPLEASEDQLIDWCRDNWKIPTRRERRSVRTPEQMGRFLYEYSRWVSSLGVKSWTSGSARAQARYEEAWLDVTQVYTVGRYVALKLLEYFRRSLEIAIDLPDMRPRGGWSPREGLALLYPDKAAVFMGDDREDHLEAVNFYASIAAQRLAMLGAPFLDRYETQVMLCDFKQAWNGRQYPGRSQDSELEYWEQAGRPDDTLLFGARKELFPVRVLGEQNSWLEVRKPLTKVLREYGYTWSDLKFSWLASRDDLANPVAW